MATPVKVYSFVENLAEKVHNLGADQLVWALTNTAPVQTNTVLANITQIAYTNLSSRNITVSSSSQTTGTYKNVIADVTVTSTGGSTGPFRYAAAYNDTATNDELIVYYDYGSSITLADGESFVFDADPTNGLLQIT